MNQEENSKFNFEPYCEKVVFEHQANTQLRRKKTSLRAHMAAFLASAVIALAGCAYVEVEENKTQTEIPEEKRGIPFDEEKIKMLEGNVEIAHPEAFTDSSVEENKQDGKYNSVTFDSENAREDAKNELMRRGVSSEEAEQMLNQAEKKADEKDQDKDLTLTQVFGTGIKNAINNALRVNEIIGKEGLSTSEIEQIINKEKTQTKADDSNKNQDYWFLTGNGYHGINPPQDTSTSVWIPTGDQTAYYQVGEEVLKSDPIWQQVSFDFGKVIGKVPYEEMTVLSNRPFDLAPVYGSVKDAIEKQSPIRNSEYYESLIGSKVGVPFVLVNGVSARVENLEELTRLQAENLAFPLIRNSEFRNGKTVGYMNGSTIVERLSVSLEQELENEKTF